MCSINHGLGIGDDRVITAGKYLSSKMIVYLMLVFAI